MEFLKKEYSKYNQENKIWKSGLFVAVVILFIFILFQPFGFRDKAFVLKAALFPGYALLAFAYSFFTFHVARSILKKKKIWRIKDELISLLIGSILLTLAIHLFSWWVAGDLPFTLQWYFKLLYHVASILLVIVVLEFFYFNHRWAGLHNKKLNEDYKLVKQELDLVQQQAHDVIPVSLEKEQIGINRNKIVFIQSMGNYLHFYLREANGEIIRMNKRGRLHQVEKDLIPFTEFFRCHRAFIINLKQVAALKGNVKSARLIFNNAKEKIPVSRSFYTTLKEQLEAISLS